MVTTVAVRGRPAVRTLAPILVAAAVVATVRLGGWQGVDVPAHLYRIAVFRRYGFTLWDPNWYGGHYALPYSVLFPPVAVLVTLPVTVLASALLAVYAFDRLVRAHLTATTLPVVTVFALGLVVPVAVGQYPYLAGEAVALLALVLAAADRRVPALLAALTCALFSPVAGAFLALACVAWAVADPPRRRGALTYAALAAVPLLVLGLLFPDPGVYPFWGTELVVVLVIVALGLGLLPARLRALRAGLVLYGAAAVVLFLVPNPMGGVVGRLAEDFTPALAVGAALAVGSELAGRRRLLVALAAIAFAWQLSGLVGGVHAAGSDPSSRRAYFAPVLAFFARQASPGRVEIPFTRDHWEASSVAPYVPLARGWERQLDITNNPLFYSAHGLTAGSYRRWLDAQGVSFVALPDVPLDYSSRQEGALLAHASALGYLREVWHDAHWTVWRVTTSPGLVTGPARLVSLGASGLVLDAARPGAVTVRVHPAPSWAVESGAACVAPAKDGWTHLQVLRAGRVTVHPAMNADRRCATDDRRAQ